MIYMHLVGLTPQSLTFLGLTIQSSLDNSILNKKHVWSKVHDQDMAHAAI